MQHPWLKLKSQVRINSVKNRPKTNRRKESSRRMKRLPLFFLEISGKSDWDWGEFLGKWFSGSFLEVFRGQSSRSLSSATVSEVLMSVSLGNIHVCIPSFIWHSEEVLLTTIVFFSVFSSLFSKFWGRVRFFCRSTLMPLAYLRLSQFSPITSVHTPSLGADRELPRAGVCFSSVVVLALLATDGLGLCLL